MVHYIAKLSGRFDKVYIRQFLKIVAEKCKQLRKPKYSNEYYLYHISLMLTDLSNWKSLQIVYRGDNKKYHYKTIQDKQWSKLNIYEEAYRYMLKKYKHNKFKKTQNCVLFIDSANIYNKNGSQNVEYGQNPKKKKHSPICTWSAHMHLECDKFDYKSSNGVIFENIPGRIIKPFQACS